MTMFLSTRHEMPQKLIIAFKITTPTKIDPMDSKLTPTSQVPLLILQD